MPFANSITVSLSPSSSPWFGLGRLFQNQGFVIRIDAAILLALVACSNSIFFCQDEWNRLFCANVSLITGIHSNILKVTLNVYRHL
jgi:hypothetical protein